MENRVSAPQALIFDMDGVLVNTIELHYRAWQQVAAWGQIPFTRADMDQLRGKHRLDCLRYLFRGRPNGLTRQEIDDLFAVKDAEFGAALPGMGADDILPGVLPLLEAAQARGLKLGVASSSTFAQPILKQTGLERYFEAVADAFTVTRSKPEPDVFVWVAGALRIPVARAVVFEDAAAGVAAARRVQMFVVGLGSPHLVGEADLVLPSLTDASLDDILTAYMRFAAEAGSAA